MQFRFLYACVACLTPFALAQQSAMAPKSGGSRQSGSPSTELNMKNMFEAKIKTEWDALKNKDQKAYGALLADDYEGVEVDNRGERNKIQAINEVVEGNVYDYTLWGFKLIPLGSDAAFVIYEVTLQFPPRSVVRYSRVYVTELWVKRGGKWKELHYQETHVK
ncbi:MAG: nuclear transport factor 2 family protein [Terriglobales bacterium]